MKCTLCGQVFDEHTQAASCARCPLISNCRLICCPNCGFETPAEPEWLRKTMDRIRRKKGREINRPSGRNA